jgi:putative transcriptional regulator
MTTNRKFKSDAFEAIHSSASALRRVRAIDEDAMREFDVMCLIVHSTTNCKVIKGLLEEK